LVVVDTERSPAFAEPVREAIEAEFSEPIVYLVNTHGHMDHTFGNQVFADATIIAHESVPEEMEAANQRRTGLAQQLRAGVDQLRRRLESLEPESEAALDVARNLAYYEPWADGLEAEFILTLPNVTFKDRMRLDLGDLNLELVWFGRAHTHGDILVYCPEEQLLLVGDLLYSEGFPYIDTERVAYLDRWYEVLSGFRTRNEGIARVVTGHEVSLPLAHLDSTIAFIAEQQQRFADKESALSAFRTLHEQSGLDAALLHLREMHRQPEGYYMLHPELDQHAYRMMLAGELEDALAVFLVLAELFPDSDVAFDSLGEVYVRLENTEAAVSNFRRALQLNPDNGNSARRLGELGGS
jgi:glyoxylase-like metal-dependent hydrolase (beta-lactamase superfamily II)